MFITTANQLDPIPGPLKDRMEVIRLAGYSSEEKLQIAKNFIIRREIEENGLADRGLLFSDEALQKIISDYTREAGVRNLQRTIASICRKVAKEITQEKAVPDTALPLRRSRNCSDRKSSTTRWRPKMTGSA